MREPELSENEAIVLQFRRRRLKKYCLGLRFCLYSSI